MQRWLWHLDAKYLKLGVEWPCVGVAVAAMTRVLVPAAQVDQDPDLEYRDTPSGAKERVGDSRMSR